MWDWNTRVPSCGKYENDMTGEETKENDTTGETCRLALLPPSAARTWPHSVHSFSARSSLDTVARLRSSTGLPLSSWMSGKVHNYVFIVIL